MIVIEICYAAKNEIILISLKVPLSCTIARAIIVSGILDYIPDIDFQNMCVGIFGRKRSLQDFLKKGDRIEIYRPLIHNPNTSRLIRENKLKNKKHAQQ